MRDPSYGVAAISGPTKASGASHRARSASGLAHIREQHGLRPLTAPKRLGLHALGHHGSILLPHAVSTYRALGHAHGYPRPFNPYRHDHGTAPLA